MNQKLDTNVSNCYWALQILHLLINPDTEDIGLSCYLWNVLGFFHSEISLCKECEISDLFIDQCMKMSRHWRMPGFAEVSLWSALGLLQWKEGTEVMCGTLLNYMIKDLVQLWKTMSAVHMNSHIINRYSILWASRLCHCIWAISF